MNSSLIFQVAMFLSVAAHGAAAVWMAPRTTPPMVATQIGKTSIRLFPQAATAASSQPKQPHVLPVETSAATSRRPKPQTPFEQPRFDRIEPAPPRVDRVEQARISLPEPMPSPADTITATAAHLAKDDGPTGQIAPAEVTAKADADRESDASRGAVDSLPSPWASNPTPIYPTAARQDGVEGQVTLRITVGSGGHVLALAVHRSSGSSLLDGSAATTVRNWKFAPARRRGVPVDFQVLVPIVFKIADPS